MEGGSGGSYLITLMISLFKAQGEFSHTEVQVQLRVATEEIRLPELKATQDNHIYCRMSVCNRLPLPTLLTLLVLTGDVVQASRGVGELLL